ncbi:MAG: hypothetical protein V3U92_05610 [Cellulophaga sp.]
MFEKLLRPQAKKSLQEKYNDFLTYDASTNTLTISDEDTFKKIFKDKKVIGGLISKIAFSVACTKDMSKKSGFEAQDKLGRSYKKKETHKKQFVEDNIKGKFIYYNSPSTGFCIGDIFSYIYKKQNNEVKKDFGNELQTLQQTGYEDSIAFSCDYVSLDYLVDKENSIQELDDLAIDSTSYLFTGILGNCDTRQRSKLQGILYAIDKNLFQIYQFLKNSDTTGLTKYFREKFNYTKDKEQELIHLLVADNDCRKKIKEQIKTENDFTFDTILGYYVDRLYRWKPKGNGLYYDKTTPDQTHLKNILEVRKICYQLEISNDEKYLSKFIEEDLLHEWRLKEKKYFQYEEKANALRLSNEPNHGLHIFIKNLLLVIISPVIMIPAYIFSLLYHVIPQPIKKHKLWKSRWLKPLLDLPYKLVDAITTTIWIFTSNPSYLYSVGSVFLVFELISSISHIFKKHFPDIGNLPVLSSFSLENYKFEEWSNLSLSSIIYSYLIVFIITLIFLSRKHLELKENKKYVYRNEQ